MTEHTWLGVKAEDGARRGPLTLRILEDGCQVMCNMNGLMYAVDFAIGIAHVNKRTLEWIRSIAALDQDTVALLEAGEILREAASDFEFDEPEMCAALEEYDAAKKKAGR